MDAVDPNLSINDDRSACSDSWNMQFVTDGGDVDSHGDLINEEVNSNTPKGELINQGVEANTLYDDEIVMIMGMWGRGSGNKLCVCVRLANVAKDGHDLYQKIVLEFLFL